MALQFVKSAELPLEIFTEATPFVIQGAIFGILPDLDHLFKGLLAHRCGLTHSIFTFSVFMPVLTYAFSIYFARAAIPRNGLPETGITVHETLYKVLRRFRYLVWLRRYVPGPFFNVWSCNWSVR